MKNRQKLDMNTLRVCYSFDIEGRKDLFDILEDALEEDGLHMINILVELTVRIGKTMGEYTNTNICSTLSLTI